MSDQNTPKGQGIVKPYLGFIDTHILFKKPVSCFFAVVSLLIPVYFLLVLFQLDIFRSGDANLIIAGILVLLVLAFAGIFGACIWWHRRIVRDEGPKYYDNFRRFFQTLGEWFATVFAIIVFGSVLVMMALLGDDYFNLVGAIPVAVPEIDFTLALVGPVVGFLIIIATKIFLFLLDPIIWLIKQLWGFLVRIVKYCYRCVINICGTIEKNTPIWSGIIWLLAIAVIIAGLVLCFNYGGLFPVIALALGLAFISFLIYKKKHYDA